jgi:hypothetical protein
MGKGAGKGAGKGFGIEDLSPSLRKFGSDPSGHLREFAGKKVAVDVSHTLHAALRSTRQRIGATAPELETTAIIPHVRGLCDIYEKSSRSWSLIVFTTRGARASDHFATVGAARFQSVQLSRCG